MSSHGILTRVQIRLAASEYIVAAYFTYTTILAVSLPLHWPIPLVTIGINVLVLLALCLLTAVDRDNSAALTALRGVFPLPLVLLAYRQMGWFAQPMLNHRLEDSWIQWDRIALPFLRPIVESLGPIVPSILEIAYGLASPTPLAAILILFALRRQDRLDAFWFSFLFGAFAKIGRAHV